MKVIIDTNLWVSFLIGHNLSALKSWCKNEQLSIYICKELVSEFLDVVSRPKITKYITAQDIFDTLKLMECCVSKLIQIQAVSPVRDAKDLYLLSLADTVSADYIITGDKDLLILEQHNQTQIVTRSEFMQILNSSLV
ncbi:MAG: putative toxin-antitoxin system toxin component, PIN family [Candidatus Symbiothrix sp.]|jgi:putative PIN family toxin of toxin-antitoxin system|nr:putative toxin-antitoxin system toxin component, PIN family [Candidatus Symbiothrix sp.]